MLDLIDAEIERRLPDPGRLVVDPAIEAVALPLSGKAAPEGLRVFPRGSVTPVEGDVLRFFVYWRQRAKRTDFDLSAIITGEQLDGEVWLSYTNLSNYAGEHSGDITSAADGASEFINLDLGKLGRRCVIPQVYVYAGEGFAQVAENFFGFMTMAREQKGLRSSHGPCGPGRRCTATATSRCRSSSTGARTGGGTPSGCTCTCAAGSTPGAAPGSRRTG